MPVHILQTFAAAATHAEAESGDVFSALGIDWQMLLFQIAGFTLLVWLMSKYIYPIFMRVIDERQAAIEESVKAADEAKAKAGDAEAEIQKVLKKARLEARDIVATAKEEATSAIAAAEAKAKQRAEKIIESGHEQIKKDIQAAQKTLHNETLELVAQATETITKSKLDGVKDAALIKEAVAEASK